MSAPAFVCPRCGVGGPNILGHEVRGVYDGVLFWSCIACNRAWPRDFAGYGTHRTEASQAYVETFNCAARAGEAMA